MKFFSILVLALISLPLFANPLWGEWVHCFKDGQGEDIEHRIEFGKNNVEFEVASFLKPSNQPCGGTYLLMVGKHWYYEVENSYFMSTSFSTYLMLTDIDFLQKFNKEKFCGHSNWKVNERFDCSDDKFLSKELGRRGYKTKHDYILKDNELHIIADGETTIYRKVK